MKGTVYLTGIRGFAALIVVLGHCSNVGMHLLGIDLTGTAKSGVWLFFILSAYLLAPKLLDSVGRKGWVPAVSEYAVKRLARILPLYYAVLAALWVLHKLTAGALMEHIAMVRGDMHFWTIPVEMSFYGLLPAIVWLVVTVGSRAAVSALLAVSAVTYVAFDPARISANTIDLANYLIFFVIGVALSQFKPKEMHANLADVVVVVSLAITLLLMCLDNRLALFFALPWSGLIVAGGYSRIGRFLFAGPMIGFVGTISFGLYLFHFFLIAPIQRLPFPPMIAGWIVLVVSVIIASIAYYCYERPCENWGKAWRYSCKIRMKATKR